MRVAIVHYWLVSMPGGEKVLEALCQLFPEADIFTHVYDPGLESETIRRHKIVTTFINSLIRCRVRALLQALPPANAARARTDRSTRLRSRHQQRIRPGQRDHTARWRGAYLLLSLAHALRLEHVSRLPRARRLVSPSHDAAALSLFAHLGCHRVDAGRS